MTNPPTPWINFKQAAVYLSRSEPQLRRDINCPDGPPFRKVGRKLIFHTGELDAWLQSRPGFNLPSAG